MFKHYKNGFYVSDNGKVKRVKNSKTLKVDLYTSKKWYKFFILFNTPDTDKVYVHRAVAELFIPQKDKNKYIVDHIDRNRQNNRKENLRWVDYSQNMKNRNGWKKWL